jgi:hypothetical protein
VTPQAQQNWSVGYRRRIWVGGSLGDLSEARERKCNDDGAEGEDDGEPELLVVRRSVAYGGESE